METKWGQDNDKIAFGKFCTDWTGIVDIYLEWKKKNMMFLSTEHDLLGFLVWHTNSN